MTHILNLSFKLYGYIDNRELKQHNSSIRKNVLNTSSQHSFMKSRAIIDDPRDQSSVHNQSDDRRGPGMKRRKKIQNIAIVGGDPSKAEKQKDKSGAEALLGDENEFAAASEENDALKKEFEGVPRQHRETYEK